MQATPSTLVLLFALGVSLLTGVIFGDRTRVDDLARRAGGGDAWRQP